MVGPGERLSIQAAKENVFFLSMMKLADIGFKESDGHFKELKVNALGLRDFVLFPAKSASMRSIGLCSIIRGAIGCITFFRIEIGVWLLTIEGSFFKNSSVRMISMIAIGQNQGTLFLQEVVFDVDSGNTLKIPHRVC